MSEPKCPICGGDLIKGKNFPWFYSCQSTNWKSDADEICELDDCAASVPVWETLQRTRKALDVARSGLEYIFGYEGVPEYVVKHIRQVLDQIKNETALEQKVTQ